MPERWKPVVSIDGDLVYADTSGVLAGATTQDKALLASHAIPPPVLKAAEDLARGVQTRTMTESSHSGSFILEWLEGDVHHTVALVLLGVAFLAAANLRYISLCLETAITHIWLTLSGIAGVFCIISALYPWIVPFQGYLASQRRHLEANVEAISQQTNKMFNMPEEMATMIKQLDVLIEEMAAQQKNMESMRSKTDWIPAKKKDGDSPDSDKSIGRAPENQGQSRLAGGILRKIF